MKKTDGISLTWLAFITSISTLFCCTLPIIFSLVGMGAIFSSVLVQIPFFSLLLKYKLSIFIISALMLIIVSLISRIPFKTCPVEITLRKKCNDQRKINNYIIFISKVFWLISFYFAYLALPIKIWMEF